MIAGERDRAWGLALPKTLCRDLLLSQPGVGGGNPQRTFLEDSLPCIIRSGFLGQTQIRSQVARAGWQGWL